MIFQLLLLVASAVPGLLAVGIYDCPAHLPREALFADDHSCYVFYRNVEREFETAQRVCKAGGGHLVIIRDLATQNFVYQSLKNRFHYTGVVWIGLSDKEKEGQYKWVDGTLAKFTYWASGQPGLAHWTEDCVAMDVGAGGRWHDYECSDVWFVHHRQRFVCEYPMVKHTSTPEPTTPEPTTPEPTTPKPTTRKPTTREPTTREPTTREPTTPQPTTPQPTTHEPTTREPTTREPTTPQPTTPQPTTPQPTTPQPTTPQPTTPKPTTPQPTTREPTTREPTTPQPTTPQPTTPQPTTPQPTTPQPTTPETATLPSGDVTASTGCPPFNCNVDCGLGAYKMGPDNCLLCECE